MAIQRHLRQRWSHTGGCDEKEGEREIQRDREDQRGVRDSSWAYRFTATRRRQCTGPLTTQRPRISESARHPRP